MVGWTGWPSPGRPRVTWSGGGGGGSPDRPEVPRAPWSWGGCSTSCSTRRTIASTRWGPRGGRGPSGVHGPGRVVPEVLGQPAAAARQLLPGGRVGRRGPGRLRRRPGPRRRAWPGLALRPRPGRPGPHGHPGPPVGQPPGCPPLTTITTRPGPSTTSRAEPAASHGQEAEEGGDGAHGERAGGESDRGQGPATTRPRLSTRERGGWATTASPTVEAGTRARSAQQPGSRPWPSSPSTPAPPTVATSRAAARSWSRRAPARQASRAARPSGSPSPRRPQVADAVAAETDGHPGGAEPGQGQRRPVAGGDGGQRDALVGQPLDQPAQPWLGHLGQGEGVADGHLAGQAEGAGPLDDQVDGERAQLAAVVQVDVDAAAVPAGDGEDGVQVLDRPLVEAGRVEAADQVGAGRRPPPAARRSRGGPAGRSGGRRPARP